MAFTSFGFIIFVSAAGLLYYLLPKRFQWTVLLLASYAFYAIANPKGLLYSGGTTIVTFLIARSMQRIQDRGDEKTLGITDKAEKKEARARTKKRKQNRGLRGIPEGRVFQGYLGAHVLPSNRRLLEKNLRYSERGRLPRLKKGRREK